MHDIVSKLWNFCHTLRHDGVDSGDYIEQLTYLLFLKMSNERQIDIPKNCDWNSLLDKEGLELMEHYSQLLQILKGKEGILGEIFSQPIPRINNPKNLKKIITLIDEEKWINLNIDVQGAAFEGLLEKAASDGKKGAGQYFTPREVIKTIVNVMKPDPFEESNFTISDPACGTGGFLILAYEWVQNYYELNSLNNTQLKKLRYKTFYGQELVNRPRRLALMNLFLHNVEPQIFLGDTIYNPKYKTQPKYTCILTNPPFGTKGANQAPERDDFKIKTSNKQLNFIQYVISALKDNGRAAMVLPDNCLFEDKASEVLKILTEKCNLHTILRLPDGTFTPYAQGVKANVIFFQKGEPTKNIWIYDGRTNIPSITKRGRPLTDKHFQGFENCYGSDPNGKSKRKDLGELGRFKKLSIEQIKELKYKLDVTWLVDQNSIEFETIRSPQEIASETLKELELATKNIQDIIKILSK